MSLAAPEAGAWDDKVFRLTGFACSPGSGSVKNVDFAQSMSDMTLRHVFKAELGSLKASDVIVELSGFELKVRSAAASQDIDDRLSPLCGDLHGEIARDRSWWTLERNEKGDNVFTAYLSKKEHKSWSTIFKTGISHHRKSHFGWTASMKAPVKKAEEILVRVRPGRHEPRSSCFVINREQLCAGLEDGQDTNTVVWRIHFDKAALEKAASLVPLGQLFGADVMERYLKVYIRGDEKSPIIMGQLGGRCVPEQSRWEIVKAPAPDGADEPGEPQQGRVPQYVSCLQITLTKAPDQRRAWSPSLRENELALERGAAPDSIEELHQKAIRSPSPDRTGWGPAEHAKENKAKADEAFKRGAWRDAAVFYARAINHTPEDEKLYSNRSACYVKLKKYDKALADARRCVSLNQAWPKAYFRQGQALRGLQRWEEAVDSFKEGRFRDPANGDWEKEIEKTEEEQCKFDAHLREQRRLKREADMTTELNEATTVAEREAMQVVAMQAKAAGKSPKEAGELAMKGAELAKQRVHEMAQKKKAMMVIEDDKELEAAPPYRIVHEDGTIHTKGFAHTDKGMYFMGMVQMNADKPPQAQPWVEIWHPSKVRWSQGCATLRLKVTLPESVKTASELDVKVTCHGLRIGTVGDSDPIVVGDFEKRVDPDGENFAWYLVPDEKPPMLEMTLDKDPAETYTTFSYGMLLWLRLFNDDVQLGEGLFEADLTDLPPHLLKKWQDEQARANAQSLNDRSRRKRLTEEEVMEETSRNWNDEFARHNMPTRFDTNEDKMIDSMRYKS